jgi:uncharacterized protein YneF (UPF0154 family)
MKNLIDFIVLFSVLLFGVCIGFLIADDINRDNNRDNNWINELYIHVIEAKVDSLETELKALKTKERYSISVGDTTLQIVRKLKIGQNNEKVLDVRPIHKGKNIYYLELNEITELDLVIMKY